MAASTRALVMPYPKLDNCSFTMRRRSAAKWSSSPAGVALVCPRPSRGRIDSAMRMGTAIFFTTTKIIPFAGARHRQNARVPDRGIYGSMSRDHFHARLDAQVFGDAPHNHAQV